MTPAVNGETYFPQPVSSLGARLFTPSGPRLTDHGRGYCPVPSKLFSWQTGWSHRSIVMPIDDSSDRRLDDTSNRWPLQ